MSNDEFTLAEWQSRPYSAYDKRKIVRRHRVRVIVYEPTMVDVVHETRDSETEHGDWLTRRVLESREHGVEVQSMDYNQGASS